MTYIDGRFTEGTQPDHLRRGHSVAEGGALSVEVKTDTGVPQSEVGHIADRSGARAPGDGDKSLVLVSRDVYAMSGERAARDTRAEARLAVMALVPEKRMMDEALLRILRDRVGA